MHAETALRAMCMYSIGQQGLGSKGCGLPARLFAPDPGQTVSLPDRPAQGLRGELLAALGLVDDSTPVVSIWPLTCIFARQPVPLD